MILLVHLISGAVIGQKILNTILAIILAFLSHYFLDSLPHVEYNIENITKKQWSKILPNILNITLDFCIGILLISMFSDNRLIVYVCGLSAAAPDILTVLYYLAPNRILKIHYGFHQKIHFLKQIKISKFWRIVSQTIVVIISITLLVNITQNLVFLKQSFSLFF